MGSWMILVHLMLYLFYQELDDLGHANNLLSLNSHSISNITHVYFFPESHVYFCLVLLPQTPRLVRFTCEKMQAATAVGTLKGQDMFSSPLDATNMPGSKKAFYFP